MNAALVEKLAGRLVVASISGGKDSAALSLWLTEQGIEHRRVFLNTGWEDPATYEYLRGDLARAIGPITEISGPRTMAQIVLEKGMFPSRQRRWCTEELKVLVMADYLHELMSQGPDVVNAVGIRREESAGRADAQEWEWMDVYDCEVWRPLAAWTLDDVIAIHKRHGLKPNPLYLEGRSRVGCRLCIYATKAEIRLVADTRPGVIDEIREWERVVGDAAQLRYERDRAAWLAAPPPEPTPGTSEHGRWTKKRDRLLAPFVRPAWFMAKIGRKGMWPIDDVVEWSRTSHGGKQFEIFAPDPRDAGCMRWGLCETSVTSTEVGP